MIASTYIPLLLLVIVALTTPAHNFASPLNFSAFRLRFEMRSADQKRLKRPSKHRNGTKCASVFDVDVPIDIYNIDNTAKTTNHQARKSAGRLVISYI